IHDRFICEVTRFLRAEGLYLPNFCLAREQSDPLSTELVGIGKLNMTLTEFGNKDGDRSTGSTFRLHSVTQCLLASYFSLISASFLNSSFSSVVSFSGISTFLLRSYSPFTLAFLKLGSPWPLRRKSSPF